MDSSGASPCPSRQIQHDMEGYLGLPGASKEPNFRVRGDCFFESEASSCLSSTMVNPNELEDSLSSEMKYLSESNPLHSRELKLSIMGSHTVPSTTNKTLMPSETVPIFPAKENQEELPLSILESRESWGNHFSGPPLKKIKSVIHELGLHITEASFLPLYSCGDVGTGVYVEGRPAAKGICLENTVLGDQNKVQPDSKHATLWVTSLMSTQKMSPLQHELQEPIATYPSIIEKEGLPQLKPGLSVPFLHTPVSLGVKLEEKAQGFMGKPLSATDFRSVSSQASQGGGEQSFIVGKDWTFEPAFASCVVEKKFPMVSSVMNGKLPELAVSLAGVQCQPTANHDLSNFVQWHPPGFEAQQLGLTREIQCENNLRAQHASVERTNGNLFPANLSLNSFEGNQVQGCSLLMHTGLGLITNSSFELGVPSTPVLSSNPLYLSIPAKGDTFQAQIIKNDDAEHHSICRHDDHVLGLRPKQQFMNLSSSSGPTQTVSRSQLNLQTNFNRSFHEYCQVAMPTMELAPRGSGFSERQTKALAGHSNANLDLSVGLLLQSSSDLDSGLASEVIPSVTVVMEGRSIGWRIFLQTYDGYESFARALREMFENSFSEGLEAFTKDCNLMNAIPMHVIAYEDAEGDLLLAGDLSWREFVQAAKRIRILPSKG